MNEVIKQVLSEEGSVALVTLGSDGPHMVNTWNSYLIVEEDTYALPAGRMKKTEENLKVNNQVLMSFGSRAATGLGGRPGAGFLIQGTGVFLYEGPLYDQIKERFPWARAAFAVTALSTEQTL